MADLTGLPLVMSELGASAGLNLSGTASSTVSAGGWGDPASPVRIEPDWRGPPPPPPALRVAERAGCDRAPLDPAGRADDRLRLLSFVWADQTARKARVAAAIGIARDGGVLVERADAAEWLAGRLAVARPGRAHVVYHSIIWSYLGPEVQGRVRASLEAAGGAAGPDAPVAWLRMESDGAEPGAAITLTLWPGGETRVLGRADFHGAWIYWTGWT